MTYLLQKIYDSSPEAVQNLMVTTSNYLSLRKRRQGVYQAWRRYFSEHEFAPIETLQRLQEERLRQFLRFAVENSSFHRARLEGLSWQDVTLSAMAQLPLMGKEDLRANRDSVTTLPRSKAYVAKTGGTTGIALEVFYRWDDFQERTAITDLFRERFIKSPDPRLGWFSGKALVPNLNKSRTFARMDFLSKVRFYSTFHISPATVVDYVEDLNRFRPHALVGFPSSMLEIARLAANAGLSVHAGIEAIFPTAETVTEADRELLTQFYGCGVHDQYASSEGAPFITECPAGKLHLEMLTGIFEVLDAEGRPAEEGEMIVTPFSTRGTPLIRYRIGDRMTLAKGFCECGRQSTVVERIDGRPNEFLYSPERGRVNLGNISNCVKNVHGIRKFQVVQDEPGALDIFVAADRDHYAEADEREFLKNFRDRMGPGMQLNLTYVDDIPREASGKYRIVKNMLDLSKL